MYGCLQPVYRQVALLGILKAGGAFVPLDPATPAERIEYIINDARIGVVISRKTSFKGFESFAVGMRSLSQLFMHR